MNPASRYRGRFAPMPSGPLHFASSIAALGSYPRTRSQQGSWLVHIENLDHPPSNPKPPTHPARGPAGMAIANWESKRIPRSMRQLERLCQVPHNKPMRFALIPVLLLLACGVTLAVDNIVVMGLFKDTAILKIDGQQQLLKVGETSPEGVKLIAANSQRAIIEINGTQKTYELGTHISGDYSEPESGPVLRLWPDPGSGLYIANGSINGFSMKFIVDTGATLVSMNRLQAERLGINYRLEGRESVSQTASGTSRIYIVQLDSVRVGDIELKNVKAAVHDSEHPQQVLLGNSFLERINLRRDGRVLELQGNP